ncbi:MAG TPA: GNAT family N-acetyltransferase, partial [Candidatus Methanomethylicus sp.]|nr:GNAT family N-acetyltransferase [Candidatus Methanomethylicus sp.]
MEIGAASPKDFPALVRLTSGEGWNYTERDFAALWSTGCMENLVARDGKGVAGMVTVLDYGEVAWLSNVVVRGDMRGRGIGRALLGEAVSRNGGKRTISLLSY